MSFKVGDLVVRTGDTNGACVCGQTYEVEAVTADPDRIWLKGLEFWWRADQFRHGPVSDHVVYNKWTGKFDRGQARKRQVQTITKTQLGTYQVTIWSSLTGSDRSLSCFMGPDAELIELVEEAKLFGSPLVDAVERLRDILEAVPRVAAYAVTDENGNGVVVELL